MRQGVNMVDQITQRTGQTTPKPNGGAILRNPRSIASEHIKDWDRILTILNRGHWDAARNYEGKDFLLGSATFVTGFISGSAAFTQLSEYAKGSPGSLWIQILVGAFALIAGLLGAAQTHFRFSTLAELHKKAGQKFGMLRREFDEIQEIGFPDLNQEEKGLAAFRKNWDKVEAEFPPVPERQMRRVTKEFGE